MFQSFSYSVEPDGNDIMLVSRDLEGGACCYSRYFHTMRKNKWQMAQHAPRLRSKQVLFQQKPTPPHDPNRFVVSHGIYSLGKSLRGQD